MNITDLQIFNISISDNNDWVQLFDERTVIETKDFLVNISCDYSYITDPPLLADFGTIYFIIDNWDTVINGTTKFFNDTIQFDIDRLDSTVG